MADIYNREMCTYAYKYFKMNPIIYNQEQRSSSNTKIEFPLYPKKL